MIRNREIAYLLETLRSCKVEIEAVEDEFEEYVCSGHLVDQIEEGIAMLQSAVEVGVK